MISQAGGRGELRAGEEETRRWHWREQMQDRGLGFRFGGVMVFLRAFRRNSRILHR